MAGTIEVIEVAKRFGTVQALSGISLSVRAGEIFGLAGTKGAGKSTLCKLLLGLMPPSGGQIRVLGRPVGGRDFRQARRRIGYLPEHFVAYDNLTGSESLQVFADLRQVSQRECRAVLDRVGLADAAGKRVGGYSRDMRQRLGLAQAIVGNPELIFLDEPTDSLDAAGTRDFYCILQELQRQGTTIVISAGTVAGIGPHADTVAVLASGRIAAHGTLTQVRVEYEMSPTSEFAAAA